MGLAAKKGWEPLIWSMTFIIIFNHPAHPIWHPNNTVMTGAVASIKVYSINHPFDGLICLVEFLENYTVQNKDLAVLDLKVKTTPKLKRKKVFLLLATYGHMNVPLISRLPRLQRVMHN